MDAGVSDWAQVATGVGMIAALLWKVVPALTASTAAIAQTAERFTAHDKAMTERLDAVKEIVSTKLNGNAALDNTMTESLRDAVRDLRDLVQAGVGRGALG